MSMSKKVSADTVREEMRVLNAAANDVVGSTPLSWLTPEFWTMVTAAATNVVAVLVLIGWVNVSHVESLTQAVTAVIGATQIIVVNTALVWKYLSGRTELRARMIDAQYQYMSMVAVEKLRAHN